MACYDRSFGHFSISLNKRISDDDYFFKLTFKIIIILSHKDSQFINSYMNSEKQERISQQSKGIIIAEESDIISLNKIEARLNLCHSYIDDFRSEVSDYLPFLRYDLITALVLLKFCVRVKKCTVFFTSAMSLLEAELQINGLKLPKKQEIHELIASFHQNHQKLTLFFQTIEHFFSPEAPYLKEEAKKAEFQKENPWDDVGTSQYSLSQMCQIVEELHIGYILFRRKIEIFIIIFSSLRLTFHCKEKYILFPVIGGFKNIECQTQGLIIYSRSIGKLATLFKQRQQKKQKEKQKPQKATQKKQVRDSSKGESEGKKILNQVGHGKNMAWPTSTKTLYSTIKQNAKNMIQAFFGGPTDLFQKQQQWPEQFERLLKEQ